ncbi:hypothetical protein [Paenibacillus apiarius]|uniref:hypothetical protein n=1 Tax=Paenibacillus apiarius TaxID=46240 RepID=UPI003B3B4FD6
MNERWRARDCSSSLVTAGYGTREARLQLKKSPKLLGSRELGTDEEPSSSKKRFYLAAAL